MNISALTGENLILLEEQYQKYIAQEEDVSSEWVQLFKHLENGGMPLAKASQNSVIDSLQGFGIINILDTYRAHGHLAATIDPLGLAPVNREVIDDKVKNIPEVLLDTTFDVKESGLEQLGAVTLRQIINWLEKTYCSTIGFEHYYLVNDVERTWLQSKIETANIFYEPEPATKLRLFDRVVHADFFRTVFSEEVCR